ncbi:MAG: hypothetical protein IH621_04610 [Krumholzibacteria bacterium]|nr:hypothetical protein [Candidatus Krumholzibacteria bacterium]
MIESDYIAVGRIVSTYSDFQPNSQKVSRLVVDQVLFGAVAVHDTLDVNWATGKAIKIGNLVSTVANGSQYVEWDELTGVPALWLLKVHRGLRGATNPLLLDGVEWARFQALADLVEAEPAGVDSSSWYSLQFQKLEMAPEAAAKRAAFVEFVRDLPKSVE